MIQLEKEKAYTAKETGAIMKRTTELSGITSKMASYRLKKSATPTI